MPLEGDSQDRAGAGDRDVREGDGERVSTFTGSGPSSGVHSLLIGDTCLLAYLASQPVALVRVLSGEGYTTEFAMPYFIQVS